MHVHANALLTGSGTTAIMLADLRDPRAILADPKLRAHIDLTRPVGLLLVAILHFITSSEDPAGILATLRDALPDGSYLALSHGTADFHPPGTTDEAGAAYQNAAVPLTLRAHSEITAYFDGFDLLEPGLVQAPLWRPDGKVPGPKDLSRIGIYAGVGLKAAAEKRTDNRTFTANWLDFPLASIHRVISGDRFRHCRSGQMILVVPVGVVVLPLTCPAAWSGIWPGICGGT